MDFKNRALYSLSRRIIQRNHRFKNLHSGKSCYFFGNAKSLKYYDLNNFKDKISFGCNSLFLHKDFSNLGVSYYYNGDPLFFYPYWRNFYTLRIEKNLLGSLYAKKIKENNQINYFINVSDYPNIRGKNIFYVHHFGKNFTTYQDCSLDGVFNANQSALSAMLGMAIFLGFEDVTLVGFDHLLKPKASEHFYEYGKLDKVFETAVLHENFLKSAQEFLKLKVVSPNSDYIGHIIQSVSYEELTGSSPFFKENTEIIDNSDLKILEKCNYGYSITKKQFLQNNPENYNLA